MTFVVRTTNDPVDLLPRVRDAVRGLDPSLPISEVRTLDQVAADALSQTRFTTRLLSLLGGLALTAAGVGALSIP